MPIRQRYHIHICLVRNESPSLENALQAVLAEHFFLTWDLVGDPKDFMDYTRQQIDHCDYLLFILGDEYGELSPSGVSYLHLNYIYATTKKVPMVGLIKTQADDDNLSRQRTDLANLVEKDHSQDAILYFYDDGVVSDCLSAFNQLIHRRPTTGWIRAKKIEVFEPRETTTTIPTKVAKPTRPSTESLNVVAKAGKSKVPASSASSPNNKVSTGLVVSGEILLNYSAHAYQDGNLQELIAAHTFSWVEILNMLKSLPEPFSNDMMLKRLNDSIRHLALAEANKVMPNAHAVSRCQINALDFQWLKQQLVDNQWLLSAKEERSTRELWRVNPKL